VENIPKDLLIAMEQSAMEYGIPLRTWVIMAFDFFLSALEQNGEYTVQ